VRAELGAIQAARRAGLSYEEICKGLHTLGIEVSARTLRHTVYRIQGQQGAIAPAAALDAQIGVTIDLFAAEPPEEATPPNPASASSVPSTGPSPDLPAPASLAPTGDRPAPKDSAAVAASPDPPSGPCRTAPAEPPGTGLPPAPADLIRQIRETAPDLDQLADRYRRQQAAQRPQARPAARVDATSPDPPSAQAPLAPTRPNHLVTHIHHGTPP
jgi:hypothetical protein